MTNRSQLDSFAGDALHDCRGSVGRGARTLRAASALMPTPGFLRATGCRDESRHGTQSACATLLLVFSVFLLASQFALADNGYIPNKNPTPELPSTVRPPQLEGVGIDEKLGAQIDLNLTFIAENGYPVALKDFFHKGRPVILNLVYYRCPMLCTLILNVQVQ